MDAKLLEILSLDIGSETLNLSPRVINGCKGLGIKNLFELVAVYSLRNKPESNFSEIFGDKSVSEIEEVIINIGIDLALTHLVVEKYVPYFKNPILKNLN